MPSLPGKVKVLLILGENSWKKKLKFSRWALFHMKTTVGFKYFVSYCSTRHWTRLSSGFSIKSNHLLSVIAVDICNLISYHLLHHYSLKNLFWKCLPNSQEKRLCWSLFSSVADLQLRANVSALVHNQSLIMNILLAYLVRSCVCYAMVIVNAIPNRQFGG